MNIFKTLIYLAICVWAIRSLYWDIRIYRMARTRVKQFNGKSKDNTHG